MMDDNKVTTMQSVASATGLSLSTVSRILNTSDFASEDTRERVMKAAKNLGYVRLRRRSVSSQPMPASLPKNSEIKNNFVNIVLLTSESMLDNLESPDWVYRSAVPALHRIARKKGFHLILSSCGSEDQWKPEAIAARNITGVLWLASCDCEDILARISETVPVVVLNNNTIWPPQTNVMCSNRMALFKAVEHLHELGHRRVGYFDVDENTPITQERLAGYHEAIRHFGLDTDPALCILEKFGFNEHPQAVARAMDRMAAIKSGPTAMIASLRYSMQFLKEVRQRSIRVPDDLSIVAIDDAPAAEWADPALTVVDTVFGRCAEVAVELLLEGKKNHQRYATILVKPELIVRKSTAKPR